MWWPLKKSLIVTSLFEYRTTLTIISPLTSFVLSRNMTLRQDLNNHLQNIGTYFTWHHVSYWRLFLFHHFFASWSFQHLSFLTFIIRNCWVSSSCLLSWKIWACWRGLLDCHHESWESKSRFCVGFLYNLWQVAVQRTLSTYIRSLMLSSTILPRQSTMMP